MSIFSINERRVSFSGTHHFVAHDATLVAPEVRIVPSVPHSRSPELALSGDGAVVAWIEQAPEVPPSDDQGGATEGCSN